MNLNRRKLFGLVGGAAVAGPVIALAVSEGDRAMIIEDLSKYTLYAHADGNSVETVMNSDNEGHGRARDEGYSEVSEVDYWLIRLKQDREERDRKAIEEAILEAKAGLAAEVL